MNTDCPHATILPDSEDDSRVFCRNCGDEWFRR
jgi:hypothetical protein